jgi:hypothetical protein
MFENFRFKFPGIENVKESFSQAYQDMFVLSVLNGKRNGTFLEVGAFDPVIISNTYLLERDFGWNGAAVDHSVEAIERMKNYPRKCFASLAEATTLDFDSLLDSLNLPERIDYLSLDIEPNVDTLACMKRLLLMARRFTVVTFETDHYAGNEGDNLPTVRDDARKIMSAFDYVLVAGNIALPGDKTKPFEDWYLDGSFFDEASIVKFKRTSDDPIAANDYVLEGETI